MQRPIVLAGPILRRVTKDRLCLWLALSAPCAVELTLAPEDGSPPRALRWTGHEPGLERMRVGTYFHLALIDVVLDEPLPVETWIAYDLRLAPDGGPWLGQDAWGPELSYPGRSSLGFRVTPDMRSLIHGSCRKPHHAGRDALPAADRLLETILTTGDDDAPPWPSAIVLSGDQVYVDDVAGPTLRAIGGLIEALGVAPERLDGLELPELAGLRSLFDHPDCYYRREQLLPDLKPQRGVLEVLFAGARKPVFTSDNAHNHLITLGEMLSMYLLVWSPVPWRLVSLDAPDGLAPEHREKYEKERRIVEAFRDDLGRVRRLLAHLPVAMIFDDHDLTDDWNLNRDWEEAAYGHPFSTRVIGNALIGYFLCQGWGNQPEAFPPALFEGAQKALDDPGRGDHDALIQTLFDFEDWHFTWKTEPPIIVLDTRTRRWRSESAGHLPSGLLDWEALTDLQQELQGRDAVVLVSAAPIFGVKLIENLQKFFTWIGKPLLVDAEYWLAHPGTAYGILNVFRHRKTPQRFTVLSGDVHYSFVYDVELRGRRQGADIWQICSSGIKNTFPERLLDKLDRLNRILYAPGSPLNWLTSRRQLRIAPRKPRGIASGRRLFNANAIGVVEFDDDGAPERIRDLTAEGDFVTFDRREKEARWD